MPLLFQRRAQVTLQLVSDPVPVELGRGRTFGPVLPLGGDYSPPVSPVGTGNDFGLQSEDLHLSFKAEKNNLGQPNTLDLTVINLSAYSRKRLQASSGFVQLLAGYQADAPSLPVVFQGLARSVDHVRKGSDWLTRVQCGDGETGYRFGYGNQSFAAGTPTQQIATYLAKQVQAADPKHIDISGFLGKLPSIAFPVQQFASGYAMQGNAFAELTRLLGGNYELTIQNGQLSALQSKETTLRVWSLSAATGLIESPEHGTPNANGLPSILKARCLLNARINVGDAVSLDTVDRENAGSYRVQKLTHSGDLAGNDWFTDLELLPLSSGVLPTP